MLIACALLGSSGCETTEQATTPPPTQEQRNAVEDARWPFWPTAMRFHPLTRVMLEPDRDELIIEARVEFSDDNGSTTKAFGELLLQLIEAGTVLEEWTVNLADLPTNALRYDDITRTYLFRLEIDQARYSPTAELFAGYLGVDGTELRARLRLDE